MGVAQISGIVGIVSFLLGGWITWTWTSDHYQLKLTKIEAVAEAAKVEAELKDKQNQKVLEDVSNAWKNELKIARNNSVVKYVNRMRPEPCQGILPENTGSTTGITSPTEERLACRQEFVADCAEDALKVLTWQEWYRRTR